MSLDVTTGMIIEALRKHFETEPPSDMGNHPGEAAHEEQAKRWHLWNEQRRAYETILAPRLIRAALEGWRP